MADASPLDLSQIETYLKESDFQYRLKAIAALRHYPPATAIPLFIKHLRDEEFLVRSFVARELGHHLTDDAFAALLQIIKLDGNPNVRAEAANSLSLFGPVSAAHLVQMFVQDDHWLVRRSILAALTEMHCSEELYEVCTEGLNGDDPAVREAAVDALAVLSGSSKHVQALEQLLVLAQSPFERIRIHVAHACRHFDDDAAKAALNQLRQDPDHRVVGAAIEGLIT
ncbi:MAG: HEAT repeat domain-containing protein [Leptolyngbyaceae cyanobacterium]